MAFLLEDITQKSRILYKGIYKELIMLWTFRGNFFRIREEVLTYSKALHNIPI